MARRPKIELKECRNCLNKNKHCFICHNFNEWELDIRKELKGHPSERDMERMIKLTKKDYGKK